MSGIIGLKRRATVLKYNGDGQVTIKLDDTTSLKDSDNTHNLDIPAAWSGPFGEFIGGIPEAGNSVTVSEAQGEWFISGYVKSDNIYNKNINGIGGLETNLMAEALPGRILLQTKKAANRIYLDPAQGIHSGSASSEQIIDVNRSIISHNMDNEYSFTASGRHIKGIIKRDQQNSNIKSVDGSVLDGLVYDDYLNVIAMDVGSAYSVKTVSNNIRNLPLTEERSIIYEFDNIMGNLGFQRDDIEATRYGKEDIINNSDPLKVDSRATAFSLSLQYPNHLIEKIVGSGVDSFGNLLDLNRNILDIGRKDELTFGKNTDHVDTFRRIRALHRRNIAYHFELNARKQNGLDDIFTVPAASDNSNYARSRSMFSFDVDKEGVFKANIPCSSETGNVLLTTRYVNASTLLYESKDISDPNSFITEADNSDIYLESFGSGGIKISGDEGEIGPIDRFTEIPIRAGTAFHDITKAGFQFTKKRITDDAGGLLIRYMEDSLINQRQNLIQYAPDSFVATEIFQSGSKANCGGRSGMISLDGHLTLNIGASTSDRQSLWVDCSGGIVKMIGRDLNNISELTHMDGDYLLEIGGPGLPATKDTRFINQNAAARDAVLDIRVLKSDGQLSIIRIDGSGISIASPGRLEISCEQELLLKSNTSISLNAPVCGFYTQEEGMSRFIKRNGVQEI